MPLPFLAPSLVAFRAECNARWPGRDKASDGWIGDAAHSARESDHNPDERGMVHAFDLDEDLDGNPADAGPELGFLAEYLRGRQDPRIKYVIYEARIFAGRNGPSPWLWRKYVGGSNLHTHHMHISVTYDTVGETDQSPWLPPLPVNPAPPVIAPQEEDEMSHPVISVKGDTQGRAVYKVLLQGDVVELVDIPAEGLTGFQRYKAGVDAGLYRELKEVDAATHDIACAEAKRLPKPSAPGDPGPAGPPGPPGEVPAEVHGTFVIDQS